jgi:type IV fimbrial biogenesis protein FimT
VLAAAVPAFTTWIGNSQIRNTAEALLSGIQLARAEAVRRNIRVRFQLTDSAAADCVISGTGTNWVISAQDVTHQCNVTPAEPPITLISSNPYIIRTWFNAASSLHATVTTEKPLICFDGLGRQLQPPSVADDDPCRGSSVTINIASSAGTCAVDGGPLRCLRIILSINGQTRLCDPALPSTDPKACQ